MGGHGVAGLRVRPAMQADEAVGVAVPGIVMRPMHDRWAPWVVHHLAADLDAVAGAHRAPWRNRDVVDDLDRSGGAARVECLVHAVGARTVEVTRRRRDGS